MKLFYSILFFVYAINLSHSQTAYNIDVSSNIESMTVPVTDGNISIKMININPSLTYKIHIKKEDIEINLLEIPSDIHEVSREEKDKPIGNYYLKKNEKLTIEIKAYSNANGNEKLENNYIYVYKTEKRGEWITTFGFNFIYLTNNNTYFSEANSDGTFSIKEGQNKEKFVYQPSLMFTWVNKNNWGKSGNWKNGLSGGIGYNFKSSLSVFVGGSVLYNENITLTLGLAIHNQKRLSSKYMEGDIINENLDFDQLHSDYIRVNPFISLSFRLDKNPFKS